MFALEIEFHDGISAPETVFIRRASAVVGSSDQAHVVIEGIPSSSGELRIVRGIGREFRCQPVRRTGFESATPTFLEGTYRGMAELKLGDVTLRITALDVDLCFAHEESPDSAAYRILQRALVKRSPVFPALAVNGAQPVMLSFAPDQPLLIGRSRKCGLRFDASDVSSEHARVGVEDGGMWIEDLGSTNGTYVDSERVSGRSKIVSNSVIQVGSEFLLSPVLCAEDVARYGVVHNAGEDAALPLESTYPCILTDSEIVKPQRLPFRSSGEITIGRDPANDVWINAPHISRQHLMIKWSAPDMIQIVDQSSNGTYVAGNRIPTGESYTVGSELTVLDLCSGITLAICQSERDEALFRSHKGGAKLENELPDFNENEQTLSGYKGSKAESWGKFSTESEQNEEAPVGVFEKLAERHGNLAIPEEDKASEQELLDEESGHKDAGSGQNELVDIRLRETDEPLSGVLEEEDSFEESELYTSEDKLLRPEDYQAVELESPGGARIQKILLWSLIVAIFGFCLMLVFGFFSENYFY